MNYLFGITEEFIPVIPMLLLILSVLVYGIIMFSYSKNKDLLNMIEYINKEQKESFTVNELATELNIEEKEAHTYASIICRSFSQKLFNPYSFNRETNILTLDKKTAKPAQQDNKQQSVIVVEEAKSAQQNNKQQSVIVVNVNNNLPIDEKQSTKEVEDVRDRLSKLKELHYAGVITDEEYEQQKKRILEEL